MAISWWRTTTGFSAGFPQGSVIMPERIYRSSGGAFCDEKGYSEVQTFFREKVKSMPGAEHSLDQVLERIQVCGPRRAAQRPEVSKFLANWYKKRPPEHRTAPSVGEIKTESSG